jgi:sugar diacid utilization regulator/putative methionine-R-sulfoxide reductase with GAF domain
VTIAGIPPWVVGCLHILEAGSQDAHQVFEALVAAVRDLGGADGAAVVSWHEVSPQPLVSSGPAPTVPPRRLPDLVTAYDGAWIVSIPVQGEIDLLAWRLNPRVEFQAEEIEMLRLLAMLAATAVGLPQDALSSLYRVARKLLGSKDLEEVLLDVVTTAAQVLRSEMVGVFLVATDGETLEAKAVVGHRTVDTARLKVRKGQGLVGYVFGIGAIYRVNDWTTDPVITKEFLRIANMEGTRSAIGAPMDVDGQTVGVLAAWRRRRSVFSDSDAELIRALADLGAVAVQRAVAAQAMQDMSKSLVDVNSELARHVQEAEHALRIHERLTRIVVDGAELPTLLQALRDITGKDVAILGFEGTIIQTGADWLADLIRTQRKRKHKAHSVGATASLLGPDSQDRHAVVVKILSGGIEWGELAVSSASRPVALDILAAEQAATACAVLLSRQDAVAAAVRRLESEFVWDLLEGRIDSDAEAIVRAHQLARELPRVSRVVLLSAGPSALKPVGHRPSPEQIEQPSLELARRVADLLDSHGIHARSGWRGQILAMIIPDTGSADDTRQLCAEIVALGRKRADVATIGVSAPVTAITQYPAAFRQAAHAMRVSSPGDKSVLLFEDLGVLQFLIEPAERADFDLYLERVLGALMDYDRKHGSNLVGSLAAYLDSDCHLQRAAAALFIHHKTMSYRLTRISALTGLQLDSQEDRFRLHLALKILELRHAADGSR